MQSQIPTVCVSVFQYLKLDFSNFKFLFCWVFLKICMHIKELQSTTRCLSGD